MNYMKRLHNKDLVSLAQRLRNEMTKEEKSLWYGFLRKYPVKVLRQKVIGDYIVDFYCPAAKLVIEVDGIQHKLDPDVIIHDIDRTDYFRQYKIEVYRINNGALHGDAFGHVCAKLDELVKSRIEQLKD